MQYRSIFYQILLPDAIASTSIRRQYIDEEAATAIRQIIQIIRVVSEVITDARLDTFVEVTI